jgi:Na+-transporting NADH:ubiquinone oxidoreductase subunit NqrA
MPKYEVEISYSARLVVQVEAKDEDQASYIAIDSVSNEDIATCSFVENVDVTELEK